MATVSYDGNKLIPAPFVSIAKDFNTTDDGRVIGTTFTITVRGTFLYNRGSPKSDGSFWTVSGYPPDETIAEVNRFSTLLRKQEALRALFAEQGKSFEVQGEDGAAPLKCNPRVKRIEFPEGGQGRVSWNELCQFTITLEADVIYVNGQPQGEDAGDPTTYKVSKCDESWSIEVSDENKGLYRVSHSVSAIGKRFYNDAGNLPLQAWENARAFVLNRLTLGLDSSMVVAAGVLDATSLQSYNYTRTQSVNEAAGSFACSEHWLSYNPGSEPPAIDECTVNVQKGEDGITRVSVAGTITGLEVRNNTSMALVSTRATNALSKWTTYVEPSLLTRAQDTSSLTLNSVPLSSSFGKNDVAGTIVYERTYNDRVTPTTPGAISEIVNIQNDHPGELFSSTLIIGRPLGHLLNGLNTVTPRKRNITIDIQMPAARQGFPPTVPNTNTIVAANTPTGSAVFMEGDRESWSERSGKYTRTTSFTWTA